MRSRYSAFVREQWEYLAATMVAPFGGPVKGRTWVGLTVHDATANEVEFTARWLEGDRELSMRERSGFEQRDGRWLYARGDAEVIARKVGRNEPCPCGSGKKLKACHG
ncbi:MAG: SEC-C domain-containing protein [Archangiaceae bacterium]|nr:SEC-C domain-containing protein [Archangiaceae bacterium]